MRRHDRLALLGACHVVLWRTGLRSQDAYRSGTRDRLAALGQYRTTLRELVAAGHPDVMRALWPHQATTPWLMLTLADADVIER